MATSPEQAVAAVLDMIAAELAAGNVTRARVYAAALLANAEHAVSCGMDARVWEDGWQKAQALVGAVEAKDGR